MEKMQTECKSKLNMIVWLAIFVLFSSGIVANYWLRDVAWALRLAGWIVLACVLVTLAFYTYEGKKAWIFAKDARIELRKVVWPTRQETVQTTIIVASMVVVMALIMWGLDSILLWIIGRLTV